MKSTHPLYICIYSVCACVYTLRIYMCECLCVTCFVYIVGYINFVYIYMCVCMCMYTSYMYACVHVCIYFIYICVCVCVCEGHSMNKGNILIKSKKINKKKTHKKTGLFRSI